MLTKNQYIRWNCLKRGAWAVCRFKWGLGKKEEVVFLRGVISQCTLWYVMGNLQLKFLRNVNLGVQVFLKR